MAKLEDITRGATIKGVLPDGLVTVIDVKWIGSVAIELTKKNDLRSIGFRIGMITLDSYQSKDTLQILENKGYRVDELSVNTKIEPYNRLKMALYESRVIGYEHDTLIKELKGLEKNKKKGKVDHRKKGSKDVSDALAGVIYSCETRVISEPVAPSLGMVESPVDEEVKRKQAEVKRRRRCPRCKNEFHTIEMVVVLKERILYNLGGKVQT